MKTIRVTFEHDSETETVDVEVDANPVDIVEAVVVESTELNRLDITNLTFDTLAKLCVHCFDDGFESVEIPGINDISDVDIRDLDDEK